MVNLQPMGIRAVAEGVGQFNNKVGSMNKSLDRNNKALAKTEKTSLSLKKVMTGLGIAVGAATTAIIGMKKVFAFGRQGALITQTGESFDFLIKKIGAAPDLLDQLSRAAGGTITQLDLMSSTATLLAGAGDDLAIALADATPRLLEIAKAANKLNPQLGDTAFFYNSIATGVKRAQPLILDNLGITIKVGEANEAFAKSIGKTVNELNAEEKAMAILVGTLEAGDTIIQQVGGSTDSATDSFDRLITTSEEITNIFKGDLFKAMSPYIIKLAGATTETLAFGTAVDELGLTGLEAARFIDQYGGSVDDARAEIILMAEKQKKWFAEIDLTVIDSWNRQMGDLSALIVDVEEQLKPAMTLDINILRGMSQLETMSSFLNQWSQEQQQKLRLKVHIETTLKSVEAGGKGLEEFQHGGQFTVGGKPGVDQNLVAFRASRGEVVTVTPTSHVDNRSVNMGDVNIGQGGMSPQQFDRSIRDWMGA